MAQTKTCPRCKQPKPLEDFGKSGTQTYCTPCKREYEREYYYSQSSTQRTKGNQRHKDRVDQRVADVAKYLSEHPCVDCGESDIVVLDFDHVRSKKHMNVSRMVRAGYAWETVLSEIAKCEVRCANCHRRVTAKRRQYAIRV